MLSFNKELLSSTQIGIGLVCIGKVAYWYLLMPTLICTSCIVFNYCIAVHNKTCLHEQCSLYCTALEFLHVAWQSCGTQYFSPNCLV